LSENSRATWDKRYKQRHYGYRDFAELSPLAITADEALSRYEAGNNNAYYVFGTNARAVAKFNWPQEEDWKNEAIPGVDGLSCYAREVLLLSDVDAWVRLVSENPVYERLVSQGYSVEEIAAYDTPKHITEVELWVPSGDYIRLYPTLAYAVIFRANAVAGTLYVWIDGNVEGDD
jgi:hypothetical protein